MARDKIILGYGTFYIGENAVGVSRGGGQFTVERVYRDISADGDKGSVKGMVVLDESRAKLKMNLLELTTTNLPSMYPATGVASGVFKAKADIATTDYHDVKWVGKTKDGKAVTIELTNAINKDNIDWTMADRDEVVAACTFEACYDESSSTEIEPWSVTFATT